MTFSSLKGEIIEIKHMNEIHPYVQPNTFIVFDLDNTLIEPTQELGTDQWFYYQFLKYQKDGMPVAQSLDKALAEWHAIQLLSPVKIVEQGSAEIIKALQKQNFPMIGLTTRGLVLSYCSVDQLRSVNVDLALTAPCQNEVFFKSGKHYVLFHEGTLFTNGSHKGTAFCTFLEKSGYLPKHVLFINDKASHIREIETACGERNISFTGLRYGYLDEKVASFQEKVAELQFEQFGKFLTNEDAHQLLNN